MGIRLVFEVPGVPDAVFVLSPNGRTAKDRARSQADVARAIEAFRVLVREAIGKGGCRSFVVGVHVEGEACDHEIAAGGGT